MKFLHSMRSGRREFLAGASVLALAGPISALASPANDLPHIIFIMADDLGYADLTCTGSRHTRTPNIDRLAARGRLYRQGYANSCVCSATRTALLTGCYQQRFAVGLEEPISPASPPGIGVPFDRPTIASVLRKRGYETALVGKWHLGDAPTHGPLSHGYDHFFGITPGGADYFRHRPIADGREVGTGLYLDNEEIERPGYLTDLLGDEAVRLVENCKQPLFMSLHFTAPHWPWEGREDEAVARAIGNFMHLDGGSLEIYADMVAAMDENVGRVVDALERKGMLENTLIVFTSDNGGERFSDTWPFVGVKGELLEGGIRVPLIVQWPRRVPAGSVSDQVVTSMDFLPTFLALAGGAPDAGMFDGMDLSAELTGASAPVARTLYWRYNANDQQALRQGDWKYLKIRDEYFLFDLATDVRERANRATAEPERLEDMRRNWSAWNEQMLPYLPENQSSGPEPFFADRY